jgi:outer membrane protein TolC
MSNASAPSGIDPHDPGEGAVARDPANALPPAGPTRSQRSMSTTREGTPRRGFTDSGALARMSRGFLVALGISVLAPRPALALQPVTVFLDHAKTWNPQNRAAHATLAERDAEVDVSTGSLLPNLSATALYTRNEYEVTTAALIPASSLPKGISFPNEVIQPQDQFDGNVTLTVPIVNIASWDRRAATKATLEGARAEEANADLGVQKSVLRDYYLLLGDEAVLLSANKNLEVAQHNVQLARDRQESGTGSELDVQRALADRARAEQNVTAAQLGVTNTRRDLYSLTGVLPEAASAFPEDDLHEEPPLEGWMSGADRTPSVKSAEASRESAEKGSRAARSVWIPSLSGIAEEKFTNATAFSGGHSAFYLLQAVATWRVDTTLIPQMRAQDAMSAAARANEDRALQLAEDAIFRDWHQIRADIESSRSSRAQVAATKLAASLAEDRYKIGVATQLDVLQARQDAFSADVARIQADADLAYARLALRLDAGRLGSLKETR